MPSDPNDLLETVAQADQLSLQGRLDEAEPLYQAVLAVQPEYFEALRGLGDLFRRRGQFADAVDRLAAAVRVQPDDSGALTYLGFSQAGLGNAAAALASYDQALANRDDLHQTHNLRGVALLDIGRHEEAIDSFDRAVALRPGYAEALNNRGNALRALGRAGDAMASYDLALAAEPDLVEALDNKAILLRETGKFDQAIALIEQSISRRPGSPLLYSRLTDLTRISPGDPRVAAMIALVADADSRTETEMIDLHFALGKVFADAGDYGKAFPHLLEGNARKRRITSYDEAATLGAMEALPDFFTQELLTAGAGMGDASEQPVFVVGMPRSGTTLVEQILASHPKVFGAGETNFFVRALDALTPEETEADASTNDDMLWADRMRRLAESYLHRLRTRAPADAARIIDKSLENYRVIGLIRLSLPNARIIHVQRDALDTCVSCFSRHFINLPYTYDLAELGRGYRAYDRLMDHWRRVTPAHILIDVRYEDVVADLEGQARRIVAHCGLEWDPRCLDFHATERWVYTASAAQVRQPIYKSAIGRWRAYEHLLGPLIAELGISPAR